MSTTRDQNYIAVARLFYGNKTVEDIKFFLDANEFDINYVVPAESPKTEWIGYSLLHLLMIKHTSQKSLMDVIKLLCSRGANLFCKNNKGFTPLRLAYEIHKESTNLLGVKAKKFINDLLTIQFKHKKATNPCCNEGISHYHLACLVGNRRVVKFFLDHDIPIDETINGDSSIFPGCSGLHLAMLSENIATVQLLLQRGVDRTCLDARGLSPMHFIVEKQFKDASVFNKNRQNQSKIKKNDQILDEMSKSNAGDPNPVDGVGLSHLHVYCTRKYNFDMDECKKLLNAGASLDAPVHPESPVWQGYSSLHCAALCNVDAMILLLEKGANPFAKDGNGLTALDLCFDRHKPVDISRIFNACDTLKSLQLRNESKLSDVFAAFETTIELEDYLKSIDVGTATMSLDSPLWPGWSLLHFSVKLTQKDNSSKIQACLEGGVPLMVTDENKMTALHMAFYMNKKNCVQKLLRALNTVIANPVDKNGLSHFHIACIAEDYKSVKKFLSKNIDPNTPLQMDTRTIDHFSRTKNRPLIKAGSTPLHIAAVTSNWFLAILLLRKKADPFQLDADSLTWIHRIVKTDFYYFDLLSLPEILTSNPVAPGGLSHFHIACLAMNLKAVEALLPLTVNVNEPIGIMYLQKSQNVTCLDTALHLAARGFGDRAVAIIDLLLKSGADIGTKNADGLNPLHLALCSYGDSSYGTKEVIKRLALEYSEKGMFPDEVGLTKLHVACLIRDVSMIQESLDSGEKSNSRMKMDSPLWPGEAPLYLLIKKRYREEGHLVSLLLRQVLRELDNAISADQPLHEFPKRQKKSSPTNYDLVVNREGLTAVHISCMGRDPDIVEQFIKLGADFDTPKDFFAFDNDDRFCPYSQMDAGFYPLHFAVKYGSDEVTELLLKYKINVDCQDTCGNAPIHLAAKDYKSKLEVFIRTNDYNGGNKKNLFNKTVVDILVDRHPTHWEGNTNVSEKMQLIGKLAHDFSGEIFTSIIENLSNVSDVDEKGRNVIHHLITFSTPNPNFNMLYQNTEHLANSGYEIDLKDKEGKTPLHHAALTGNNDKIEVLLLVGADINITDDSGKVPLDYCLDDSTPPRFKTDELLLYAIQLQAAGLFVNDMNEKYLNIDLNRYHWYRQIFNEMKENLITRSFTLRDVLTEKMVMTFPTMAKVQRQAIMDYLQSDNWIKYSIWQGLFFYQRRRALKREQLYEATFENLKNLLDPRLPDHCVDSVLINLSNEDWISITSTADQCHEMEIDSD